MTAETIQDALSWQVAQSPPPEPEPPPVTIFDFAQLLANNEPEEDE